MHLKELPAANTPLNGCNSLLGTQIENPKNVMLDWETRAVLNHRLHSPIYDTEIVINGV